MDLVVKATISTLMKLHNLKLYSKYVSICPQTSVFLIPCQRNFSLQQRETNVEKYNEAIYSEEEIVWYSAPTGTCTTQILHLSK